MGESRRHVEHGAGGARDRDPALPRDVPAGERPRPVDLDAVSPPVGARDHLERRRPVLDVLPEARCRAVAEDRAVAAGEHGRMGTGLRSERDVPDRIHAGIHRDQTAGPDAVLDLARAQADREQLETSNIPVLLPGQSRYRLVEQSRHRAEGLAGFGLTVSPFSATTLRSRQRCELLPPTRRSIRGRWGSRATRGRTPAPVASPSGFASPGLPTPSRKAS